MFVYQNNVQDKNGNAIVGATVTVRVAATPVGTGALASLFSNSAGTLAIANPVFTDANGMFSCAATDGFYDIIVTGTGVQTQTIAAVRFEDYSTVSSSQLAASSGSSLVGFKGTATGEVATNVSAYLNLRVKGLKKNFAAVGDGAADDTTPVSNAIASGKIIEVEDGTFITAPFVIPNNFQIIGYGPRASIIKMKAASNGNLISATLGSNVLIQGITLDGNNANNTSGRCISFTSDAASDGPALVLRDAVITNGPLGGGDNSSAFFSGLSWMVFQNVRYVNNKGTLWLSTNDSLFEGLYVGNSGVVANVPAVVVGGNDNKFIDAYFGGNGASTGSTASQVQLLGASYNSFIACTNDSANGSGYEFQDTGSVYSTYNQIIGGLITNPSQNVNNTYYHVVFNGNSSRNIVNGAVFHNYLAKKGKFGIAETGSANNNLVQGCIMGTFGTQALATIGANGTRVLDCQGLTPQGAVSVALTGSPMTYTNTDSVRELIYIYGGTVTSVVKNGVQIATAGPVSVWLETSEAVTVTYTVGPSIVADRK